MKVKFNQFTPRMSGDNVESVKIHFVATININGEETTLNGSLSSEDFVNHIDFEQLENMMIDKIASNIVKGEGVPEE